MDALDTLWLKFLLPFVTPLLPVQRIYVVYLVSAIVLAFAVYLYLSKAPAGERPKSFLAYCFPKAIYLHPSALVDYAYFVINKISFAILLAPFIVGSVLVSGWTQDILSDVWGTVQVGRSAGLAASVVFTLCMVLASDFAIFVAHYLQHKVPLLWEFHKVHHSAEVMTPITVYRMHPVDDLLVGSFSGVMTGVVHGLFAYFYEGGIVEITVWKLNLTSGCPIRGGSATSW
jgi:sterol desaturase/sphingolipid hydroxylase (fatty acid hydroxylase superfamily)